MSSRLTSLLVKDGVTSVKDIERALRAQVFRGGSIDTALLEAQSLPENTLVIYQGRASGYRTATPAELENVDSELAKIFTLEYSQTHGVVPLKEDTNSLHLLTFEVISEDVARTLHLELKRDIEFCIAPQYRFAIIQHQLWGKDCTPRLLALYERQQNPRPRKRNYRFPSQIDKEPSSGGKPQPNHIKREKESALWNQRNIPSFDRSPLSVKAAMQKIQTAQNLDSVFFALLRATKFCANFSAILTVHGSSIVGRTGIGPENSDPLILSKRISEILLPLDVESPFRRVVSSGAPYIGPITSADVEVNKMVSLLGHSIPKNALLLPILFHNLVVAIIVGHSGEVDVEVSDVSEILPLATLAKTTFETLVGNTGKQVTFPAFDGDEGVEITYEYSRKSNASTRKI